MYGLAAWEGRGGMEQQGDHIASTPAMPPEKQEHGHVTPPGPHPLGPLLQQVNMTLWADAGALQGGTGESMGTELHPRWRPGSRGRMWVAWSFS